MQAKNREGERPAAWSRGRRIAVSGFIVLHLAAVFIPPFSFATRGPEAASPFAMGLRDLLRPYFEPLYLDHGYAFFAPEPGPSHLLRCRLEFADGRPTQEVIYPDRRQQWPRLLYHRHFMLAEQLHSMYVPGEPPPTEDRALRAQWRAARDEYERRRDSFAGHLKKAFGAERVEIVRVEHRTLSPQQRSEGLKLTDPSLYEDLLEEIGEELQGSAERWETQP